VLIAEELTLQHFFGARVIGTLHEASVWLCGFIVGAAQRVAYERADCYPINSAIANSWAYAETH
jgi:hypothetical protein